MATAVLAATALLSACGEEEAPPLPPACDLATAGAAWLTFASTSAGNQDLYLVRADGTCLSPLTSDTGADLYPAWVSSGSIGFQSSRAASGMGLYVHDLGTGAETEVPVGGLLVAAPAWTATGSTIAFEGSTPGLFDTHVYTVSASGGAAVALTSGSSKSAGPAWSADGATIYFVSNRTGPFLIYSMSASGTDQLALPGTNGVLGRPAISPDGTSLAYARMGTGGRAEVVVRTLASGLERVVSTLGDSEPAFDPSGTRLAIASTRGGRSAIWVVDAADGGHPVQVTIPSAQDGQPAFRRP